MTQEQKEQIAAEIDNQGFDYWIQNYGVSSLEENDAPEELISLCDKADKAISALENAMQKEGCYYTE